MSTPPTTGEAGFRQAILEVHTELNYLEARASDWPTHYATSDEAPIASLLTYNAQVDGAPVFRNIIVNHHSGGPDLEIHDFSFPLEGFGIAVQQTRTRRMPGSLEWEVRPSTGPIIDKDGDVIHWRSGEDYRMAVPCAYSPTELRHLPDSMLDHKIRTARSLSMWLGLFNSELSGVPVSEDDKIA